MSDNGFAGSHEDARSRGGDAWMQWSRLRKSQAVKNRGMEENDFDAHI